MHRHATLNRVYRLVWSQVHRTWVVVAETARGRGKRASRKLLLATAASALATANLAQAGPTGGQVTAGNGAIARSGNTTTIHQASQNLALAWQSFNTSAAETVNFVQPSNSAIAVNRIVDSNGTQFMGRLNANGQVVLINPNGVLFGAGSQINVGGLVASTLDIDDGSASSASRRFSGNGSGSIVNQGSIAAAEGGYVAFVGNVVKNAGSITAPLGSVALGAGSDVTLSFAGNRLVNLQVNRSTLDNLAENGGLVHADGGAVLLSAGARDALLATVVNNTGVIEARSVRHVGGAIVLEGGQGSQVSNAGLLDASGRDPGQPGGVVKVLGQQVALTAASRIDVAGQAGGGAAYVGGNFLGAGPERNAQNTVVAAGSRIDADALGSGDGGKVALWSDGVTRFDGAISARGGAGGGNGGQVETSGATLKISGKARVDTGAAQGKGKGGNWLLDPDDITIGPIAVFGNAAGIDVDSAVLTDALNNGDVTVKTTRSGLGNGDIIVLDTIGTTVREYDAQNTAYFSTWDRNNHTLTLSAFRNIRFAYTPEFYSVGAGTTVASGGGIDLANNADGGVVELRADNSGTGIGSVVRDDPDWNTFALSGASRVNVFYNPGAYAAPTDYGAYLLPGFGDASQLSAYMAVNVAASINNKTYDATTGATLASVALRSNAPSGLAVSLDNASAAFVDKNAGSGKDVVLDGIVFTDSGDTTTTLNGYNYYINGLANQSATIAKLGVALTGVAAGNKVYDGTTAVTMTGNASVTGLGIDNLAVAGSGAGSAFTNKNAGIGKGVTVTGYTLVGLDADNYQLLLPTNLSADIARANLLVSGVGAAAKTYDGTTLATLTGSANVTAFGSDLVTVGGAGSASFADKNAGLNKAVSVSGYTLGGLDAGNYNLIQPIGLTATINRAVLQVTGVGANSKVYDGSTLATLSGSAAVAPIGLDSVAVAGSGSASFLDRNAGIGKAVTVTGYSLTGLDAANYTLLQPGGVSADISRADLALTGIRAVNKTYDGTTAATLSGAAMVTPLGADVVAVSGSGSGAFASKDAGLGRAVTVTGYTLSGLDAGNYNLVASNLTADIARANLAISGVVANNKTYDGTLAATLGGNATVAAFGADDVTVGNTGSASFVDKNAGTGKAVVASGFILTGADADNYQVVQPTGLAADIARAGLALNGLAVQDKVYDATTAATLAGSASVTGIGLDQVSVSGTGNAVFADKNAGADKAVTVSGFALGGADAGNYTILPTGGLSATISRASLLVSGLSANSKTYDGTTIATLNGIASVTPLAEDRVVLGGVGSGVFADKNAGTGKAVTLSGYSLTGLDAGNYTLVAPGSLTADIGKALLAVSGVVANNKVYDGTTGATLGGNATVTGLDGDDVAVSTTGSASFVDKNAGSGKAVVAGGFTLLGIDAGNYRILQPSELSADIARAGVALSGLSVADKVYDATMAATLRGAAGVRGFGEDQLSVSGEGVASFADKNAGTGKAVLLSGYSLIGADAGNYTLLPTGGLSASITRAALVLTGLRANSRVYDGSVEATLSGTAAVAALGEDSVSVSGLGRALFADKNAGVGKAVTVSGYALSGPDAGNYTLLAPAGLRADITRASLAVSGIAARDKAFDGGTGAIIDLDDVVFAGRIDGDDITLDSSGNFADATVGDGKLVNLSNRYGGADIGNYTIASDQASTLANIVPAAPSGQLRDIVAQVQSLVLPALAGARPDALTLSPTLQVSGGTPLQNYNEGSSNDSANDSADGRATQAISINTTVGAGRGAPRLVIRNGGLQLPPLASTTTE